MSATYRNKKFLLGDVKEYPNGIKRDRDEMFANLTLFTMYCKTIYDLIAWLKKGKLKT